MIQQVSNRYDAYRDSGIEWLGDIPDPWKVNRLKDFAVSGLTNGIFKTKDQFGTGVKLVNVTDLYQNNSIINNETLDKVIATTNELKKYFVKDGDIFFVRSSLKLEGVGVSALFESNNEDTVFECHIQRFHI